MEVVAPHITEVVQSARPTTPGGHRINAHGFHNAFFPDIPLQQDSIAQGLDQKTLRTFLERDLAATEKMPLGQQYGYANSWYAEIKNHDSIDERLLQSTFARGGAEFVSRASKSDQTVFEDLDTARTQAEKYLQSPAIAEDKPLKEICALAIDVAQNHHAQPNQHVIAHLQNELDQFTATQVPHATAKHNYTRGVALFGAMMFLHGCHEEQAAVRSAARAILIHASGFKAHPGGIPPT